MVSEEQQREKRKTDGPSDYRKFVRSDMLEDPWAHLTVLSKEEKSQFNTTSNSNKTANTPDSPLKQAPDKHQKRDEVQMKAHPDRQQRINEYQSSGAAPPTQTDLRESIKATEVRGLKAETTPIAPETTSRLSSDQNPGVQSKPSMADILSEFL